MATVYTEPYPNLYILLSWNALNTHTKKTQ